MLLPDCGQCKFCVDIVKFGGPGRKKQRCSQGKCVSKTLRSLRTKNEVPIIQSKASHLLILLHEPTHRYRIMNVEVA